MSDWRRSLERLTPMERLELKQYILDRCVWEPGSRPTPCLVWKGTVGSFGYGLFGWNGVQYRAHCAYYTLTVGPIPDDLFCLHHCDNPPCAASDHLYCGTQQDNVDDMWARGRAFDCTGISKGECLSNKEVLEIRQMGAEGHSYANIARRFSVAPPVVRNVIRGETYKDCPGPITIISRAPVSRSRFTGVRFEPRTGKWTAQFKYNGINRYLGTFHREIDAARAWNDAVIAHNLNRPLNEIPNPDQRKETPCVDQELEVAEVTAVVS